MVYISRVFFFSKEVQSSLVQINMPVEQFDSTCSIAVLQVAWQIFRLLSVFENHGVDMTVIKLTLIDLSELVWMVTVIYQLALDTLWLTLKVIITPIQMVMVMAICRSIKSRNCYLSKWEWSKETGCQFVEAGQIGKNETFLWLVKRLNTIRLKTK